MSFINFYLPISLPKCECRRLMFISVRNMIKAEGIYNGGVFTTDKIEKLQVESQTLVMAVMYTI